MAAPQPPARRRRRPRRGSLERPVNARLYRASFLVVLLPLVLLAFTVTKPVALQAPLLPPAFDGDVAAGARPRARDRVPGPHARQPRRARRRDAGSAQKLAAFDLPTRIAAWQRVGSRARPRAAPERDGGRQGPVARRDRRDGAPRRHRRRAGRERQRERHRGAARARAHLRAAAVGDADGRAADAHARLPLDRRRRVRRPRRAPLRAARRGGGPRGRGAEPRRARRVRARARRARGRPAALAGDDARPDGVAPHRRADRAAARSIRASSGS